MLIYKRAADIAGRDPRVVDIIFLGNYKTVSNHIKVIPNIPTEDRMDWEEGEWK